MEEVERMAGQREGKAVFGLPFFVGCCWRRKKREKMKEKERKRGCIYKGFV